MRRFAAFVPLVLLAGSVACSSGGPSAGPSGSASTTPPASASGATSGTASPSASGTGSASAPPLKQGPPKLALVGTFTGPDYLVSPPGDPRLFVVEQRGRILVVKDGKPQRAPFLDISGAVRNSGEQGLLSVAFAPDFATSKRFYVDYNGTDGDLRIAEFRVGSDPDRADRASHRELLRIPKPYPNHNGGLLVFDAKGMLLIGVGDGGSANDPGDRAQNLGDLHGKLLRIDPRASGRRPYTIPKDNPFVGRAGARGEVWAYGLRNPWRYSFDGTTGDLYIGDVGQYAVEEVDAVPPAKQRGANYGWRVFEGRRHNIGGPISGPVVAPVHTFTHDGGRCAVMGGVVYRGSVAALRERYLFGDFCTGQIWSFRAGTSNSPAVSALPFTVPTVNSFGVDAAGEVYVVSGGGRVYRITA